MSRPLLRSIFILIFVATSATNAQELAPPSTHLGRQESVAPQSNGQIRNLHLKPEQVHRLEVGTQIATTIMFEQPISSAIGHRVSDEPTGDGSSDYHLQNAENGYVVAVRALREGVSGYLTVVIADELFVFHLVGSASPVIAVTTYRNGPPPRNNHSQVQPITSADASAEVMIKRIAALKKETGPIGPTEITEKRQSPTAERMISLVKLSRAEPLARRTLPELFKEVETRHLKGTNDYGQLRSVVTEAHRFRDSDAIVLVGEVENRYSHSVQINPAGLGIEVGNRRYPVTLADFPEVIAPNDSTLFFVALQGGADGKSAHLSVDNEFRLGLSSAVSYEEVSDLAAVGSWKSLTLPEGDGRAIDATLFPPSSPKSTQHRDLIEAWGGPVLRAELAFRSNGKAPLNQ